MDPEILEGDVHSSFLSEPPFSSSRRDCSIKGGLKTAPGVTVVGCCSTGGSTFGLLAFSLEAPVKQR